jgi:hypothetical protein
MNPSFSPQSLKGLQPTVDRYVEQLINGVGNELSSNGGIVEMNKWFHNFSFDVPMLHSEGFNGDRLLGHWRWEQISERWQQTATNRISSSKLSTGLSLSLILWFLFVRSLISAFACSLGRTDFASIAHAQAHKGDSWTVF